MAYSENLREHVRVKYDEGRRTRMIAAELWVSPAWARRVKQRGGLAYPQVGGSNPKFDGAEARLAARVDERPDATLEELRAWAGSELVADDDAGSDFRKNKQLRCTSGAPSRNPSAAYGFAS